MADPQPDKTPREPDPSATPPPSTPPPAATPPPAPAEPPATSAAGDVELGEGGKKALEAERKARREAEARATRLDSELEKARTAQLGEQERAVEEARQAGRAEARGEANEVLLRAEATAKAAGKLRDPSDAPAMLGNLDRFLDAAGNIDGDAMVAALDELVTAKPYLAATAPSTDPPAPPAPAGRVPPGPRGDDPVKFKRSQLRDQAFYEANKPAILAAAAAGLIEDD